MRRPLHLFFSFDARLHEELKAIARHHQSACLHRRGIWIWGGFGAVVTTLLLLRLAAPGFAPWLGPALLLALIGAVGASIWQVLRNHLDLIATARAIEQEHPELKEALRTAAEQKPGPDGRLNFLQRRLLKQALDHAAVSAWHQTPRNASRQLAWVHFSTLALAVITAGLALRYSAPWRDTLAHVLHPIAAPLTGEIEVTPGDEEIESGSTVVIAARFPRHLPAAANLVWHNAAGESGRFAMARSLSDPVFAFTLANVTSDTVYAIDYGEDTTAEFALTVFELPSLVRADAALDYPAYTGLEDRTITDTRRIGAVEGTQLDYTFLINRPIASAELRPETGAAISLEPRDDAHLTFGFTTTLRESARYKLHLTTADGRVDPVPADIRIEVAPNQRPELTLNFPRGDQRVSPIQEIHFGAQLRDDYGLLDYGIATAIGSAEPDFISFAPDTPRPPLETELTHKLDLEDAAVEVDELITWFVWADDYGPDGERRRSTGDLYFAEVRALDEIFREDDSGGGGASGMQSGSAAGDLLDIQRQLSIAIWNLKEQGDASSSEFTPAVETLHDSQARARSQLAELRSRLDNPRLRGSAELADQSMGIALDELSDAASAPSLAPLDAAWTASQTAFQALLRLQPKETNLVQSNNGSGGGSRNRAQIDQLRMRREANNYANQSQAQSEVTPEDREQLNLLSRLRELSRRQQDLNARLQELQTALAAATSEAEREEIRRELKRLEEEQRRMLADLDDARQRLDQMQPGEQREQTRQQLDDTRDNMQQSSERLASGEVSSALAAGTRAEEQLNQTSDDMREESSSVFADQLRELRQQARELSEEQSKLAEQFEEENDLAPSLDDTAGQTELQQSLQAQQDRLDQLLDHLRQVTEDAEGTEPTLHRQLYDLLREQGTQGPARDLETSAELLRRGFREEAQRQQANVQAGFDHLRQAIERAADSVLGNEATEMRFASNELEDLARELRGEQEGTTTATEPTTDQTDTDLGDQPTVAGVDDPGSPPSPAADPASPRPATTSTESDNGTTAESEALANALSQLLGGDQPSPNGEPREPGRGPLTGSNFAEWADRLRTVESLLEDEQLRQQLGEARAQAEDQRRAWQREGTAPSWEEIESTVLNPLVEVQAWLQQELARREDPTSLQPIDRDPVPDKFTESVRRYYESLGAEK